MRAVKESAEARNLGPRNPTPISTEVSSPPEAPQGPRCTGRLLSRSQSISPLCPGPQSHIPTLAPRAPWHCLSGPRAEAFRKPLPPSKRKGRGDWEGEGLQINISTSYSIARVIIIMLTFGGALRPLHPLRAPRISSPRPHPFSSCTPFPGDVTRSRSCSSAAAPKPSLQPGCSQDIITRVLK